MNVLVSQLRRVGALPNLSRNIFVLFGAVAVVAGCVGASHGIRGASDSAVAHAITEIEASKKKAPPRQRFMSDRSAEKKIQRLFMRLRKSAERVCRHVDQDECIWQVNLSTKPGINASASGEVNIVIRKGIVEFARNRNEVAMVIAHEIAHHIANHMEETRDNVEAGAALGALAAAVLVGRGGGCGYNRQACNDAVDNAARLGAQVAYHNHTREQEMEADYLAAYILKGAGFNLRKARGLLITLGRLDRQKGTTRSGYGDTHPSSPERLAHWDMLVKEIKTRRDLPKQLKK